MDPNIASNEAPEPSTQKATPAPAPAPFVHDSGPNPWYQSRWFVWTGSIIFFLAFFIAVVYLSITESQPITATPTKPPTSAPVEVAPTSAPVNVTTAPSALNLTSAPSALNLTSAPVVAPTLSSSAPVASGNSTSLQIACDFINSEISVCPTVQRVAAATTDRGVAIPSEIGLLTALTFMNLQNSNLTGGIPSTMASLTALTYLNITGNVLTGTIPETLCAISLKAFVDCGEVNCSCCISGTGVAC